MTTMPPRTKAKLPTGITLRANGTHQIRWRAPDGQHAETFGPGPAGLKAAKKRLADVKADLANNRYRTKGDTTLAEHWATFTKIRTTGGTQATRWKAATAELYRTTLEKVPPALANKRLADITTDDIVLWQGQLADAQGLAASTIKLHTTRLGAVFTHAVGAGLILTSPTRSNSARIPIKRHSVEASEIPSTVELAKIAAELPDHLRVIVLLGTLGLRAGEIRAVQVQDLDLTAGLDKPVLHVRHQMVRTRGPRPAPHGTPARPEERTAPKHGSARTVSFFGQEEAQALLAHIQAHTSGSPDAHLVQHARTGQPLDHNALTYHFNRAAKAAGLERFSLHAMRHNAATEALDSGLPIVEVAAQLGHSVEVLSSTYLHRAHGAADRARLAMAGRRAALL